jgi:Ca-activated chloride channel family protein
VNSPLLENLAFATRGAATFVLPHENVEVKVGRVFRRLQGPVFSNPVLTVWDEQAKQAPERVQDMLPARLPDLFAGDQLLVLGRYLGTQPLRFQVRGTYLGESREFSFVFPLDKASTQFSFVPRLWATRKIASLIDAIRSSGADPGRSSQTDPRFKELVDEIVKLSLQFGIITEYTSFLAREGSRIDSWNSAEPRAAEVFQTQGRGTRVGREALALDANNIERKLQPTLNRRSRFSNGQMQVVEQERIQQLGDQTFIAQEGGRWIDSRLVRAPANPEKVVEFATPDYFYLAWRLAQEGRQGLLGLSGDIVLIVDNQRVLIRRPENSGS